MEKVIKFVVEVHFNGEAVFTDEAHRRASTLLQNWLNEKVQDPKGNLWMLVKPLQSITVARGLARTGQRRKKRIIVRRG